MRQAVQAMGDPLGTTLLGAPGQRAPADSVLSRLLSREVAVLGGRRREEIIP
jgi:hypothetical protein